MNVDRDTVNSCSLIGRFEGFESNIHDINAWTVIVIRPKN